MSGAGDAPDLVPPTLPAHGDGAASPVLGSDLVGTVLAGRYRIVGKLGEGAMGAVYLGEHLKIGRRDAIKVLRDNLATDPEAIARFVRGTRNVSAVRHPNVCTIYDYSDTADGLQFVAMEFVPGETLKDLLQREGTLSLERAVDITAQAADALDAAHAAGIVHRDLKPANIMVTPGRGGADEVKVVDFDIAKGDADGEQEEVTRLGFVVGTPEYMSPEQLVGERLDGRSDLYSLALVLFRMITGTLPFEADSAQDLMIKRLTERPLLLAEAMPGTTFPEALERAVHRALARKPADRQADAAEFRREIMEAVAGAPAQPRPTPAPPAREEAPLPETRLGATHREPDPAPSPTPRPRPRWRAIAMAVGTVVAGGVGGMMMMQGDSADPPAAVETLAEADPLPNAFVPPETEPPAPEPADPATRPTPAGEDPTPSGAEADANPPPRVVPPPRALPSVAQTDTALFDLFTALGDPTASRATLVAVRDSAETIWGRTDLPPNLRAMAAHVIGLAMIPLGETAQALPWLEQAVQLNPSNRGFATKLAEHRERVRY